MSLRDLVSKYVVELPPEQPAPTATAPAPSSGIPGLPGSGAAPVYAPQTPVSMPTPTTSFAGVAIDTSLIPKFQEKITSEYSKSPTYSIVKQFEEALETAKEFVPEEGARFRMVLKQLHLSPDDLANAYKSIVGVIQGEDAHFQEIIAGQRTTEIQGREQSITAINAQIEQSNNSIRDWMAKRDSVNVELTAMRTKLDTAVNSFDGAAKALQSSVEENLRKIGLYLMPAGK